MRRPMNVRKTMTLALAATALAAILGAASGGAALAKDSKAKQVLTDQNMADIERAIDEKRFIDASSMIDMAVLSGSKEPRLILMTGKLDLGRGRYDEALDQFRKAEVSPQTRGPALEGEGLVLALSGRRAEAEPVLKKAVTEYPGAWRAWNALGGAYDDGQKWA